MELTVIMLAFAAGLIVRRCGYPPLLGYLAAGFIAHMAGIGDGDALTPLADAGIILLLFTIGLKLEPSNLTPRYVWGSALLHMVIAFRKPDRTLDARFRTFVFEHRIGYQAV